MLIWLSCAAPVLLYHSVSPLAAFAPVLGLLGSGTMKESVVWAP